MTVFSYFERSGFSHRSENYYSRQNYVGWGGGGGGGGGVGFKCCRPRRQQLYEWQPDLRDVWAEDWFVDCRLWTADCVCCELQTGLWAVSYGLYTVSCGLRAALPLQTRLGPRAAGRQLLTRGGRTLKTWNASNWMLRLFSRSMFIISFRLSGLLM